MGWWSRYGVLVTVVVLVPAAIVYGLSTCINQDPCMPDCSGCALYEKVPDPANCRRYYECNGMGNPNDYLYTQPLDCNPGKVFDIEARDCIDGDSCDQCPPVCLYDCSFAPIIDQVILLDCRGYQDCSLGIKRDCAAATPFFDGTSCQTDETRCCHCRPYCSATDVGKLVADPRDCRKYYACDVQGRPTTSGKCNPGESFVVGIQKCFPLAPCSTEFACLNVLGEDGCYEPFTCLQVGYFPKCPGQCSAEYFYCPEITGDFQDAESCPSGAVFHPNSHVCISADQCP